MEPLDDYPLGDTSASRPSTSPPRGRGPWVAAGIAAVVLAIVVAAFLFRRAPARDAASEQASSADAAAPSTSRGPLGADVEPRDLPPLDLTDPLVRELVAGLSSRPELAAWLASDGLIRSFVVIVDNIDHGRTPTAQLRRVAPRGAFVVQARAEDEFVVDARSYARYNGIAEAVRSLDAGGMARVYSILRPRLQDAYRELGYPEGDFDAALERALGRLLRVPVVEGAVRLTQAPVLYKYVDERLETLAPAEKQLLRMGPRNVRIVQDKLREVAGALNIPADRLPR